MGKRLVDVEHIILSLATKRGANKSICPSEAARAVSGEHWRSVMDAVHQAAITLHDKRAIAFTQGGKIVQPQKLSGPYRIKIVDTGKQI